MRPSLRLVLPLAAVALVVLYAFGVRTASDGSRVTYRTAAVERGDLVATVTATGRVEVVRSVRVGSQLSGQLAELLVDFNDEVTAGQAIARLDDRSFAARVREARARLASARAELAMAEAAIEGARARAGEAGRDFERRQSLHESGRLSTTELDRARALTLGARSDLAVAEAEAAARRAAVEIAEAALHQADIDMQRTVIRAPIDGVVIGRNVDEGQTVAASLEAPTLFTIARDLSRMEVHARVDEADIGRVDAGQRAVFTVDAYPARRFEAEVLQVRKAPDVVEGVVTYTVVLGTGNEDLALLPGMTAIVRVVVEEHADVLLVPNAALRYRPPAGSGDEGAAPDGVVWVLEEGRPVPVSVSTGFGDGSASELQPGALAAGDEVVVGHTAEEGGGSLFGLRVGF